MHPFVLVNQLGLLGNCYPKGIWSIRLEWCKYPSCTSCLPIRYSEDDVWSERFSPFIDFLQLLLATLYIFVLSAICLLNTRISFILSLTVFLCRYRKRVFIKFNPFLFISYFLCPFPSLHINKYDAS